MYCISLNVNSFILETDLIADQNKLTLLRCIKTFITVILKCIELFRNYCTYDITIKKISPVESNTLIQNALTRNSNDINKYNTFYFKSAFLDTQGHCQNDKNTMTEAK